MHPKPFSLIALLTFLLPAMLSAELRVQVGDLEPGESRTITYRVRVAPSTQIAPGTTSISSQGRLSYDEGSASTNTVTTPLFILDSDGDGVFDDLDQCPFAAAKTEPGTCGCNQSDTDLNENEIADCLFNADLKALLALADDATRRLKPNSKLNKKKKRKKQRERKALLRKLRNSIGELETNSLSQLTVTDQDTNLTKLFKQLRKRLRNALKTGNKKFSRFKRLARKSIKRLNDALT